MIHTCWTVVQDPYLLDSVQVHIGESRQLNHRTILCQDQVVMNMGVHFSKHLGNMSINDFVKLKMGVHHSKHLDNVSINVFVVVNIGVNLSKYPGQYVN
jgi:hypothetical protein